MPKTSHQKTLTTTALANLKPAAPGKRVRVMDKTVGGFGVSVTDKGAKTFFLVARFHGDRDKGPSRREIGRVGVMTLADAREKAAAWKLLVAKGIDPAVQEERERTARVRDSLRTFGATAQSFIDNKLPDERKRHDVELEIRRELLPHWETRPMAEISPDDVATLIQAKKKRSGKVAARNLLALIKRFFRWAMAQPGCSLTVSPCANLNATALLGDMPASRDHVLSNDEIVALWRASGRMEYPAGPAYRLLLLTALRLREATEAQRSEINRREGEWTIPAERMKGKNAGKKQAREHVVPITQEIAEVFDKLPKVKGPFLFSTTNGKVPFWPGAKVKRRLDKEMLVELRILAEVRGEDPEQVKLNEFVNHDIRRSVRTQLAKLRIPEEAREALLAHRPAGIKGTYNRHLYYDEKREALEMWAARLRSMAEPPADNVVAIRALPRG